MILVTGAAGFVGTHLMAALKAEQIEAGGVDKKTGFDVSQPDIVIGEYIDLVVHLASSCSTPGSVTDPLGTFRDTVLTAANILEAARLRNIPIIITSSCKAADGHTPYGAAKRMVELWAIEYAKAYGIPVVINRPGTIYGPGQEGSPESGWIAWFLKAKREGLPVTIYGDGTQVRDLLHVDDYVRLLMLQIKNVNLYNNGTIYDVGGGAANAVTVNQIVSYLGLEHTYAPPRYGDTHKYVAENNVPGWEPRIRWGESGMFE